MKRLLKGCGYQGYEFGARNSPDSICCGGLLVEIDVCDAEGKSDCALDEIPCPVCREQESIGYWIEQFIVAGEEPGRASETARKIVAANRESRFKTTEFDQGRRELNVSS